MTEKGLQDDLNTVQCSVVDDEQETIRAATALSSSSSPPSPKTIKKQKRPDGMPRKPMNAYNVFFQEQRKIIIQEQIMEKKPGQRMIKNEPGTMARIISKRWKNVSPDVLERCHQLSLLDKKRYCREIVDYHEKISQDYYSGERKATTTTTTTNKDSSASGSIEEEKMHLSSSPTKSHLKFEDLLCTAAAPAHIQPQGKTIQVRSSSSPLPQAKSHDIPSCWTFTPPTSTVQRQLQQLHHDWSSPALQHHHKSLLSSNSSSSKLDYDDLQEQYVEDMLASGSLLDHIVTDGAHQQQQLPVGRLSRKSNFQQQQHQQASSSLRQLFSQQQLKRLLLKRRELLRDIRRRSTSPSFSIGNRSIIAQQQQHHYHQKRQEAMLLQLKISKLKQQQQRIFLESRGLLEQHKQQHNSLHRGYQSPSLMMKDDGCLLLQHTTTPGNGICSGRSNSSSKSLLTKEDLLSKLNFERMQDFIEVLHAFST